MGPGINVSDRGELLDYLRESKKIHKSPTLTETPLLNIYMKSLRLKEYQGKTIKYDLTQSKRSPMGGNSKKSSNSKVAGKQNWNLSIPTEERQNKILRNIPSEDNVKNILSNESFTFYNFLIFKQR